MRDLSKLSHSLFNQTKGRLKTVFRRPFTYHVQYFPTSRAAKQCNHTQESFKPAYKSYFIRLTASVFWIFILCRVCSIHTITPLGGCRKIFQQRVFISINRRTNCSLHSNAKGRLKIPCGIFQTAFHFGYRLSNQSSPTSIVFSL